eukprot:TRINITY_DN5036_c0_g1_i1.p1 TRINITY_DN5036_c0_g1~~TRINITY_DN5036_c0_g1_i1.p1  ORF type:complete len:600 (-),score=114.19 TRINITY_DN5036_c0_g1_i1:99-1898(-)
MDTSITVPLSSGIQQMPRQKRTCTTRVLLVAAIFLLFAVLLVQVVTVTVSYSNKNKISDTQTSVDASQQAIVSATQEAIDHLMNNLTHPLTGAPILRFGVKNVSPRKYQFSRGTCWDFGTISVLEHQYRLQGLKSGLLLDDEYVQFSEQAYGAVILRLCNMPEHRSKCLLPYDRVAFNTTSGGEAVTLWSFHKELANMILPHSVCPYFHDIGHDTECDGMDDALATNPISFTIDAYSTLYTIDQIKRQLILQNHALVFNTPLGTSSHYLSCADLALLDPTDMRCNGTCTPCPPDFHDRCCVRFTSGMLSMDGEFRHHRPMDYSGGHAITLVGFNDEYMTEWGSVGGFIIRNTWKDPTNAGAAKSISTIGSHTLAYLLQEISSVADRSICGNSHNPRNWYTCSTSTNQSLEYHFTYCAHPSSIGAPNHAELAHANFQPFALYCSSRMEGSPEICHYDANHRYLYYALSISSYPDQLYSMCFMEHDTQTDSGREFCYTPRVLDTYAKYFDPVQEYESARSEDLCGYHFFPYDYVKEVSTGIFSGLGGFFVSDYTFHFPDSAYFRGPHAAGKNYDLLSQSTHVQAKMLKFTQPYPTAEPDDD